MDFLRKGLIFLQHFFLLIHFVRFTNENLQHFPLFWLPQKNTGIKCSTKAAKLQVRLGRGFCDGCVSLHIQNQWSVMLQQWDCPLVATQGTAAITLTSIIERTAGGWRDLEETRINEGCERRGRLVLRHGGSLWEYYEQRIRKYQMEQLHLKVKALKM